MEQLHKFFNIPSYYNDLASEIHSENLMGLLSENPIDYMRHLYSTDSKLFYNVRDELVLRGIGFQPEYQSNYLLDRTYDIQHILYKNDNTIAFEKIDFAMLGASNFIERFNIRSDLFFKNMPLEGILHFTEGVSFILLKDLFNEAGFLVVPVNEYKISPILAVETPYEKEEREREQVVCHNGEKPFKIVLTYDVSMLDAPVKYFYKDPIYLSFHKYCHVNGIEKFSELTVDFIGKYQYQKHVRRKTAIKAMELYYEIHHNTLEYVMSEAITLLQENSFKSLLEFSNIDYLAIINDFYAADEVMINQADFPFEQVKKVLQQVSGFSEKMLAEKQQNHFNQLIREIEDHPNLKYILSYSLAEIQEMFEILRGNSLNLELYLFDVLEDRDYKELLSDILVKLNHMNNIKDVLEKVTSGIKPRELEVLLLRKTRTLHQVGDMMGVTRERVRQIEVKARNKLVGYKKMLNLKLYFGYCTEHSKLITLDILQAFEIEGDLNVTILEIFFDIDDSITHLIELNSYILASDYQGIRGIIEKIDYSQPIIEVADVKSLFTAAPRRHRTRARPASAPWTAPRACASRRSCRRPARSRRSP